MSHCDWTHFKCSTVKLLASRTAWGSSCLGAVKRGLWRHRVAVTGIPLREPRPPELIHRPWLEQLNSRLLFRDTRVSELERDPQGLLVTSAFDRQGDRGPERGGNMHHRWLYKTPVIRCPVQSTFHSTILPLLAGDRLLRVP